MSQFMMTSFSISAFKIVMNCATYTIKVLFLLLTFVLNISIIQGRTDLQNDSLLSIIDQIEESIEKIDLQNSTEKLIDRPSESFTQIQKSDLQSKVPQQRHDAPSKDNCGNYRKNQSKRLKYIFLFF